MNLRRVFVMQFLNESCEKPLCRKYTRAVYMCLKIESISILNISTFQAVQYIFGKDAFLTNAHFSFTCKKDLSILLCKFFVATVRNHFLKVALLHYSVHRFVVKVKDMRIRIRRWQCHTDAILVVYRYRWRYHITTPSHEWHDTTILQWLTSCSVLCCSSIKLCKVGSFP